MDFFAHYWWLVFPLSGMAGGWLRAWSKASERRHQRKVELYKLKHQAVQAEQATASEVQLLMDTHSDINKRWLDYELDVGKLIDYPVMTDVREPLTVAFLRAKRDADGLRPAAPADITSKARKLLRIAEDEAATPAERQTAYKRARRELEGLIVLPEPTIAALEAKVARVLGAGEATDIQLR
jgi:hypothetical protein